ncbi:MAG TPA: hydrolase [Legionella sp.]|nr:hydrolase [Legionella sp.]
MIVNSAFKPAWWLTNAHAQTLYSTLMRRVKAPIDQVERLELPDGDFIDLAWACNGLPADAPLVIFLHGLGGGVSSTYVAGQLMAYNRAGWRGVLMHFRGASQEPNRLPRAYHSGDTGDLDFLMNTLAAREPNTKKALVGVSMGGNVVLKWLGEQGAQSLAQAAVAVSVPYQMRLVADRIHQGFSRVYQKHLLQRLRAVFRRKWEAYPDASPCSLKDLESLRCFWTFDEHVTAPLHGFSHVHAYYREASSRQYLTRITTPTLLIHALDDPFMTPDVLPRLDELSPQVTLELSRQGGHVGFVAGRMPGKAEYWLDQRVPAFLRHYL